MERKSYIEYRRLTIIEPPCLYYILLYIATILASVFSVLFVALLCFILFNKTSILLTTTGLFSALIIFLYSAYNHSRERVLLHKNSVLEVYWNYRHHMIPISSITQVSYKKQWTICGNFIVLVLHYNNSRKVEILLKETKEFLAELKKHNPNIIVPELPEI